MSLENKKETPQTTELVIPQVIEVDPLMLEGDTRSEVMFEITLEDVKEGKFNITDYEHEVLSRGARLFNTDEDLPLIIHSVESRTYLESITSK